MIAIIITLDKNTSIKPNYCLLTQIHQHMRLKLKTYVETFGIIKTGLIGDYTADSKYFDKTNKKVIGKFKDEATGIPIAEFVGLRSKMYSYTKDNSKSDITAKGIKKYVIKKDLKHED